MSQPPSRSFNPPPGPVVVKLVKSIDNLVQELIAKGKIQALRDIRDFSKKANKAADTPRPAPRTSAPK